MTVVELIGAVLSAETTTEHAKAIEVLVDYINLLMPTSVSDAGTKTLKEIRVDDGQLTFG